MIRANPHTLTQYYRVELPGGGHLTVYATAADGRSAPGTRTGLVVWYRPGSGAATRFSQDLVPPRPATKAEAWRLFEHWATLIETDPEAALAAFDALAMEEIL